MAVSWKAIVGICATALAVVNPACAFAKPKLHMLEAYCVTYELEGLRTGTLTECMRDFGHERVEKRSIRMTEEAVDKEERVIYRGDRVITINLKDHTAWEAHNPDYGWLLERLAGVDEADYGDFFKRGLGGEVTGETKTVAGKPCDVLVAEQMGTDASWCLSRNGLVLEVVMPMFVKRAVSVEIGSGGANADYQVPDGITFVDADDTASVTPFERLP